MCLKYRRTLHAYTFPRFVTVFCGILEMFYLQVILLRVATLPLLVLLCFWIVYVLFGLLLFAVLLFPIWWWQSIGRTRRTAGFISYYLHLHVHVLFFTFARYSVCLWYVAVGCQCVVVCWDDMYLLIVICRLLCCYNAQHMFVMSLFHHDFGIIDRATFWNISQY